MLQGLFGIKIEAQLLLAFQMQASYQVGTEHGDVFDFSDA